MRRTTPCWQCLLLLLLLLLLPLPLQPPTNPAQQLLLPLAQAPRLPHRPSRAHRSATAERRYHRRRTERRLGRRCCICPLCSRSRTASSARKRKLVQAAEWRTCCSAAGMFALLDCFKRFKRPPRRPSVSFCAITLAALRSSCTAQASSCTHGNAHPRGVERRPITRTTDRFVDVSVSSTAWSALTALEAARGAPKNAVMSRSLPISVVCRREPPALCIAPQCTNINPT